MSAGDRPGRAGSPSAGGADPTGGDHLADRVVDLASGDLGGADPSAVLAHLDRCPRCRVELTDAVVATAALRGAQPARVPGREPAAALPPLGFDPAVGPGPDRSRTVVAAARAATTSDPRVGAGVRALLRPVPGGHRRRVLALTAAAALVVGLVVGDTVTSARRPAATPAAVTVLLRSGAVTEGAAVITRAGGQRKMTITTAVSGAAAGPGGGSHPVVLTVWLTDPAGQTAQRVGVLDGAGRGSFTMSAGTAARYPRVVLTAAAAPAAALDPAAVVATARLS